MGPFHLRDTTGSHISPIVLASPHSGAYYPPEFLDGIMAPPSALARAEDRFVDVIVAPAAEQLDLPLISAAYGRTYIDLNRDATELDPLILEGAPRFRLSERVKSGLGVLPRLATPGVPIYHKPFRLGEAYRRIVDIHEPYHRQLAALLARARAANGFAVLIDCHSMPSLPRRQGRSGPQMVLGDRHGRSSDKRIPAWLEACLGRHYTIARNQPYAGGYTTEHHGKPPLATHAVQLEIDRALYLDMATLSAGTAFPVLQRHLLEALTELVSRLRTSFAPLRQAAE